LGIGRGRKGREGMDVKGEGGMGRGGSVRGKERKGEKW